MILFLIALKMKIKTNVRNVKSIHLQTAPLIKANGKASSVTVKESKNGPTAPSSRANGKMTKLMERAPLGTCPATSTKENGSTIEPMAWAS